MITYLYRCFDREGELLYAGITDDVERRKREHAKDKFWWRDVARVTKVAFPRRIEALWAEWAVISTLKPAYNRAVSPPDGAPEPTPAAQIPAQPVRRRVHAKQLTAAERVAAAHAKDPNVTHERLAELAQVSVSTVKRYRPGRINGTPTPHLVDAAR